MGKEVSNKHARARVRACVSAKVRLYRNGDAHFAGMVYPVSTEHHRTLNALLEALTQSVVCDRTVLPLGVRYLFAADNGRRVTSLDQLHDGSSYVCSTRPTFRSLDYGRIGGALQPSRSLHQARLFFTHIYNKKHLKNVGPIRHCEPPHAALPFTRCG